MARRKSIGYSRTVYEPTFSEVIMAIKIFKFNDYEVHVCTDRMMDEYIEGFFDLKIQENGDEADIYFDAELLFKEFFNTLSKTRVGMVDV